MTTRSQKRKAVEELVSVDQETPLSGNNQSENPVVGTSKSPKVQTENLEEISSSLRKEILSDLAKILAENQKEMLRLIAPVAKKQTTLTVPEESDSESENVRPTVTSTPVKSRTTATTKKTTPVNKRNSSRKVFRLLKMALHYCLTLPIPGRECCNAKSTLSKSFLFSEHTIPPLYCDSIPVCKYMKLTFFLL